MLRKQVLIQNLLSTPDWCFNSTLLRVWEISDCTYLDAKTGIYYLPKSMITEKGGEHHQKKDV